MVAFTAPIRNNLRVHPTLGKWRQDEPFNDTGWASPHDVTDNEPTGGADVWSSDVRGQTALDNSGTTRIGLNDGSDPQYLHFHDFKLEIPTGATIVGVTCMIYVDNIVDNSYITIDEWWLTFDNGAGGWTLSVTDNGPVASVLVNGEQTMGNATDMWGETTITPTQVNNTEFGFTIKPASSEVAPAFHFLEIDVGGIKVDYTDTIDGDNEVARRRRHILVVEVEHDGACEHDDVNVRVRVMLRHLLSRLERDLHHQAVRLIHEFLPAHPLVGVRRGLQQVLHFGLPIGSCADNQQHHGRHAQHCNHDCDLPVHQSSSI